VLVTESTIQVKSRAYQEPHVPGGRPTALWPYHRAPVSCHYCSGTVRYGQSTRPKESPSFAVERYIIRPAKCNACVQHDSRPNNGRSLIDTDGKHYSPKLCKFSPGLNFTLTLSYSQMTYFLKQIQVTTYSSQVTGNHPTSTGLSKLSNYLTANNKVTRIG
jgi:hypothetical protein